MPFIETSQEWLTLSAQLLEARPCTVHLSTSSPSDSKYYTTGIQVIICLSQTRVTTKYSISPAKARTSEKSRSLDVDVDTPMADGPASKPPRGKLIIKTYDPQSGVCLKYKTSKAAEVGRLVQMLGSLGRNMGGLNSAPITAPAVEDEAAATAETATPPVAAAAPVAGGGDGGKGKKKKKGKR